MELDEIRKKLDTIDENIVRLIAERLSYAPKIAAYKQKNNMPIYDKNREDQITRSKRLLAEELGADPKLIEKVFAAIMETSRNIQEQSRDNTKNHDHLVI
jgi:monofunctional chorismate mutase